MARVAVVTDSAACLPQELIEQYDIHVVPFGLIWGEEAYRDGVDLTAAEFYQRLLQTPELPTTSQPTIQDLVSTYRSLVDKYDAAVSIHVPRTLSSTVRAANIAAELVPELEVRVVDCGTAVMAEGFVALAAARTADAGADIDEVVRVAEAMIPRVKLYAILSTLTYLARSGRVPGVAATVGTALHIQPVFTIHEGTVDVLARERSNGRAIEYVLERMAEDVAGRPVHVAVFHAGIPEDAQALRDKVAGRFTCVELYVTEFTPVMGTHTGPGVLGVAFYAEE